MISRFFVLGTQATITHIRTNLEGIRFRLYSRWLESHARIDLPAVGQSPLEWNRTQITVNLYNKVHLASSSSDSGSSLDWSLLARFSPVPENSNLMLTIDDNQVDTILINVFQIEPADQQPPLDDIEETVESMGEVPDSSRLVSIAVLTVNQ